MRISLLSSYKALDIHNWSGTDYYISKALEDQEAEINYIYHLRGKRTLVLESKALYYKIIGKNFDRNRSLLIVKQLAQQAKALLSSNTDIIFSSSSVPLALLESNKPKVFYTDATFAGMLGFYKEFSNLCSETIRHGNFLEQKALESSKLAIFASDWAAKSAIDNYKVDPSKVKVVPFGANVKHGLRLNDIKRIAQCRSKSECHLLFIGVDWERKGADLAIKVADQLNQRGLKTILHIAGLQHVPLNTIPKFIINHGFISKSTKEGRDKLNQLFASSHFLIVPSKAEAYGLVYCEANSFGVPAIGTDVGGIPTIIKNNVNGRTFSISAEIEEWCDFVLSMFNDDKSYLKLCASSFNEYETRLNWRVTGKAVMDLLKEL